MLFLIKALKSQKLISYLLTALFFILSMYTYHSARVIVPILAFGIALVYKKEFLSSWKKVLITFLVGLLMIIPLIIDLTKPQITSRAAGVGLFADTGPLARIEEQRNEHGNFTSLPSKIIHNKAVNYGLAFLENWTEHYWGEFLFLSGDDIQRNKVPETGQMYYFDLVFILIGLISIIKKPSREWGVVILWILVAPIAAALTFQSPHALRSHNMVVPMSIVSAFGLYNVTLFLRERLNNKNLLKLSYLLISFLIVWCFAKYQHMYWVHMDKEYKFSSQYGVSELVDFIKEKQDGYKKVLVTDRYDQPYILFLFYLKYPPQNFQGEHVLTGRDRYGFSTVSHFDKYDFTSITYDETQPQNPNSLIVGTDEEIPDEANIIKDIYGSNDHLYFQVVAN